MAMSRTYLGAHWASDVVAGACIGTGLAVVWSAGAGAGAGPAPGAPPDAVRSGRDRPGRSRRCAGPPSCCSVVGLGLHRRPAPAAPRPAAGRAPHQRVRHRPLRRADGRRLRRHRARARWRSAWRSPPRRRTAWPAFVAATIARRRAGDDRVGDLAHRPGRSGATTDAIHSAASAFATLALIVAAVDLVGGPAAAPGGGAARPSDVGAVLAIARRRARRAEPGAAPLVVDRHQPAPAVADAADVADGHGLAADTAGRAATSGTRQGPAVTVST